MVSMLKMKRNNEMKKFMLSKRRKISNWLLAPECCKRLNLRVAMRLKPVSNGVCLERPPYSEPRPGGQAQDEVFPSWISHPQLRTTSSEGDRAIPPIMEDTAEDPNDDASDSSCGREMHESSSMFF